MTTANIKHIGNNVYIFIDSYWAERAKLVSPTKWEWFFQPTVEEMVDDGLYQGYRKHIIFCGLRLFYECKYRKLSVYTCRF
jgi:hypothetical protein